MKHRDYEAERWRQVAVDELAAEYPEFVDFLYDGITQLLGFECTWLQEDIAEFLQYGPDNLMIQAQRSQAKSTITAFYVVWCFIHDPTTRALVFSAGGDMASEVAKWIIQIIDNWAILACLRPSRQDGDRCSTDSYDVHWSLKGPEKSPSVACMGITASMQGRRADILIADDVESSKNASTQHMRDVLLDKTRDFASICQQGRIIYLGTPQSIDSIYNTLPGRGYRIRIWPGRYPTEEEIGNYGDNLAPSIRARLEQNPSLATGGGPTGTRGQPTDPDLLGEEALTKKEIDQGPAYFQLQHMLDTRLADEERYPLKPHNLIVMDLDKEKGPAMLQWGRSNDNLVPVHRLCAIPDLKIYFPYTQPDKFLPYTGKGLYVDPAGGGQNGDETVAVITYFLNGMVFVMDMKGFPGGVRQDVYAALTRMCREWDVSVINVEQNFGGGAFAQGWRQYLLNSYNQEDEQKYITGTYELPSIDDVWETGQKELRIADTLEPLLANHTLVINRSVIDYDAQSTLNYPVDSRSVYQLMWQMARLTRDRGALRHDDRIDALAGAARIWVDRIAVDMHKKMQEVNTQANLQLFNDFDPDWEKRSKLQRQAAAKQAFAYKQQRRSLPKRGYVHGSAPKY